MRREPSVEVTARWRESGLKAKAVVGWGERCHTATGLDFWDLEFTDLEIRRGWGVERDFVGEGSGVSGGAGGMKAASSRSLS